MKYFYRSEAYKRMSIFSTTFRTIYRNIFNKKFESEVYVLDRVAFEGSVCFDVGAAYGRYTLVMSKIVGSSGHVYSFEPGSYSHSVLRSIIKFYRLKNVTVIKKALSNVVETSKLSLPVKESGKIGVSLAHLCPPDSSNLIEEDVDVVTLDSYCSGKSILRIDFIKCDVEGAELLVFKGGRNIITRCKPSVLCEVDRGYMSRFNTTPEELYDFFSKIGYKAFILERSGFKEVNSLLDDGNYFFLYNWRITF